MTAYSRLRNLEFSRWCLSTHLSRKSVIWGLSPSTSTCDKSGVSIPFINGLSSRSIVVVICGKSGGGAGLPGAAQEEICKTVRIAIIVCDVFMIHS